MEVEHTIDRDKPYIIKAEGGIPVVEVELSGRNGLRVMWHGPRDNRVEIKNEDGEWFELPGVQSIDVCISVHEPLPIIKINQIIIPGIQGRKYTSLIVDEARENACDSDTGNEPNSSSD